MFVDDQQPVEELTAQGADHPFADGARSAPRQTRPRRAHWQLVARVLHSQHRDVPGPGLVHEGLDVGDHAVALVASPTMPVCTSMTSRAVRGRFCRDVMAASVGSRFCLPRVGQGTDTATGTGRVAHQPVEGWLPEQLEAVLRRVDSDLLAPAEGEGVGLDAVAEGDESLGFADYGQR